MEVVTERLLHEERKLKDRVGAVEGSENAMAVKHRLKRKGPKCHNCGQFGHIRRNCSELAETENKSDSSQKERRSFKQKAKKVDVRRRYISSSDDEYVGLIVDHALSASAISQLNSWIVDSRETCHMCNDRKLFVELRNLKQPQEVSLGDGHELEAIGQGIVELEMKLPNERSKRCKLHDVLYVLKLSYNLISVSKATEDGKAIEYSEAGCQNFACKPETDRCCD